MSAYYLRSGEYSSNELKEKASQKYSAGEQNCAGIHQDSDLKPGFTRGVSDRENFNSGLIQDAIFKGYEINQSTFAGADLTRADFSDATLRGVDLSGSVLRGADFRRACLLDVNFKKADIRGADFTGALLSMSKIVKAKNWLCARFDRGQIDDMAFVTRLRYKIAQNSGCNIHQHEKI